ncbi:MAG TPA: diaminopimelate epimerase [Vicinamibacteria bacterium]|jgi:diaminopimelate epimerase
MSALRSAKFVKFVKAHALGNDFLLIEKKELPVPNEWPALARALCHRRRGIGADGVVVFEVKQGPNISMSLLNQDGSLAEISGNGLRCLGAHLRLSGWVTETEFAVETGSGVRHLKLIEEDGTRFVFRSAMGHPRLASHEIPFELEPAQEKVVHVPLEVNGRTFHITALSMGNPHCVMLVDRLELADLRALGPRVENHPRFPRRTNVELVEVLSRSAISIGIWERGAGETGASGTGSAAAAVATILNGQGDETLTVRCPGGELRVEWENRDEVYVTGEAVVVAEGVVR